MMRANDFSSVTFWICVIYVLTRRASYKSDLISYTRRAHMSRNTRVPAGPPLPPLDLVDIPMHP